MKLASSQTKKVFDTSKMMIRKIINKYKYSWDIVKYIPNIIEDLCDYYRNDINSEYFEIQKNCFVHKSTKLDNVYLVGPCFIGANCHIAPGAYIRENVYIGANCFIGNATEIKNSIISENCEIAHKNYVGDSVLGTGVHLGAGAVVSNFRLDRQNIKLRFDNGNIELDTDKFGAVIGDNTQIGCNTVINPGLIIGQNNLIYPLLDVRTNIDNKEHESNNILEVIQ